MSATNAPIENTTENVHSNDLLACAYCGEKRQQADMIQRTVRHYHTQRHLDKPMWYCKEKGCAGYHQMSLEG